MYNQNRESATRPSEFLSDEKSSDTYNPRSCSFYLKHHSCRYGRNCKFSHDQEHFQSASNEDAEYKPRKPDYKTFSERTPRYTSKVFFASNHRYNNSNNNPESVQQNTVVCRYFEAGRCYKGERCEFRHFLRDRPPSNSSFVTSSSRLSQNRSRFTGSWNHIPVCRYYKRGSCEKGEDCGYAHEKKPSVDGLQNTNTLHSDHDTELSSHQQVLSFADSNPAQCDSISQSEDLSRVNHHNTGNVTKSHDSSDKTNLPTPVVPNINSSVKLIDLTSLSDAEILNLRNTEIMQMKKRFSNLKVVKEDKTFSFFFKPSDPDWPFDVENLKLQVTFPEEYPKKVCKIFVLQNADDYVQESILNHLNVSIYDWLKDRHQSCEENQQAELLFRPFLRWFDRHLIDMIHTVLKQERKEAETKLNETENSNQDCDISNLTSKLDTTLAINIPEKELPPANKTNNNIPKTTLSAAIYNAQKTGVKVILTGLQFVEGAAALSCTKISASLNCLRCKTNCNVKTPANKNIKTMCSKCNRNLELNFSPEMMHPYSNVLGIIYVIESKIIDINIVECAFLVDCLNCSKQVSLEGLHYGQIEKSWCINCNQKLSIGVEGIKFQTASQTSTVVKVSTAKKTEKKKDPLLKEGEPLPLFGTCKHYKKSHRWLRFPCCGRIYPCDVCHDEKETDHEMKYASRMICGFCSKEQPYTKDKPCTSCSSTVVPKSGAFWEGGSGCRNKVKMARNDRHKYAGTSKTISKKSQVSDSKKKK